MTESGLAIVPKPVAWELCCPKCCELIINEDILAHWYYDALPEAVRCQKCDQTFPVSKTQE